MNENVCGNIWITVYDHARRDNKTHTEAMTAATQAVKNFSKVYKLVNGDSKPTE